MNIKEAFEEIESAAYLGTEEDLKKHTEALKIIEDNLKLNNLISTDIVEDIFNKKTYVFDPYEKYKEFNLTYDDFYEIAKNTSWLCSKTHIHEEIGYIITQCINLCIEQYKSNNKSKR